MLSGEEETDIIDYFIKSAFPTRDEVRKLLDALEAAPHGLSVPEMLGKVNISKGRVEKTIALLSLESPAPIAKQGSKWQLTASDLSEIFWERAKRLTDLRRIEQLQMQEYVKLGSGHMEFLIRALDGGVEAITPPALPLLPTKADPTLIREAEAYLRRTSLPIEPRKQWPSGGMPHYRIHGRIGLEYQASPGKALCIWGDAGWGNLVRQGKYHDHHFADDLVVACANLVREWRPQITSVWVTCIPSRRHPDLVPDFARQLASRLGIPFHAVLVKTDDRPEQKTMANSTQQARNIDGSLAIEEKKLPDGQVLLVDDMVDSRWTLTVAAWLLRTHGSGEVFPLVLAITGYEK
ncbi:MAG: phosphoribosyltransferase family protein [Syntrophus sp. (in: bacteria)]